MNWRKHIKEKFPIFLTYVILIIIPVVSVLIINVNKGLELREVSLFIDNESLEKVENFIISELNKQNTLLLTQIAEERSHYSFVITILSTLLAIFGIFSIGSRLVERKEFNNFQKNTDLIISESKKQVKIVKGQMVLLRLTHASQVINNRNSRLFFGENNEIEVTSYELFLQFIEEYCKLFEHLGNIDVSEIKMVIFNLLINGMDYTIDRSYSSEKNQNNQVFLTICKNLYAYLGIEKAKQIESYMVESIHEYY